MKLPIISLGLVVFFAVNAHAQRRKRAPNLNDTISSNYDPSLLFSPMVYADKGNEYHSANGEPGPKYWQNRPDYVIKAAIDTATKTLTATETITYTNNSPDALQYLWLQLDQNTYCNDARSNFYSAGAPGEDQHTDGYKFSSVELMINGKAEKANYAVTDTRMQVRLARPLAPNGGRITLLITYNYTIPAAFGGRTDYSDSKNGRMYEIAQWFPRLCVYDDSHGWDTLPFLGSGEFYCEYGDIDYSVTVPWDMIVAGSGELQNPAEVLTAKEMGRLAAARNSDKTIMIRTAQEVNDPASRPVHSGNLTWHFKMFNTRDVAFGASKAYIWDAARMNLPGGKKSLAMSVYPVESVGDTAWTRATEFLKGSVEHFSAKWFVYPYPVAINEAGIAGGMEYPGITFDAFNASGKDLFALIAHEIGHNWFPMIVGSDERRYGWMDEGLNTFIDIYASDEFNKGEYAPKRDGEYAPKGGNPADEIIPTIADPKAITIMTPADGVIEKYRHPITYYKTSFGLYLLREQVLGHDRFDYAFRNYIAKWAYKHPQPEDFFRCMDDGAGEDLGWFWKGWFYNNYNLDLALINARYIDNDPKKGIQVTIANKEAMAMPFILEIKLKNGATQRINFPVETWIQQKATTFTIYTKTEVNSIIIDPDHALPDMNRANNVLKMR